MTREDIDQRRALRRIQNIIVVMLIGLLSALLVRYWVLDDDSYWQRAEVDVLKRRFADNVSRVRVLWMSAGKPANVELTRRDGERLSIAVTTSGWPRVDGQCASLWSALTGADELSQLSIEQADTSTCQFYWNDKPIFRYQALTGQVTGE